MPSTIPAFRVDLFGQSSTTAPEITLEQDRNGQRTPVAAVIAPGPVAGSFLLAPQAPLEVGVDHVLSLPPCFGGGPRTYTYQVGEAAPLPMTLGTLSVGPLRRRDDSGWVSYYVEATLLTDNETAPWSNVHQVSLSVGTELVREPMPLTAVMRWEVGIACYGRTGLAPGPAMRFVARAGSVGTDPMLEAEATASIDCSTVPGVPMDGGMQPSDGDGGVSPDADGRGDPAGCRCSAAGHASGGGSARLALGAAMALVVASRARRARRARVRRVER